MPLQYIATGAIRPAVSLRLALLATALLFAGCGATDSPEQQVRTVLGEMELAAEARDIGDLMEHIAEDYRDSNGLGPQETAHYVRGYFIANQSIHLLTRIEEITFPLADEARAKVLVGMVGREADAADKWDLAAELHEFNIALRREGDQWKVSFAERVRR